MQDKILERIRVLEQSITADVQEYNHIVQQQQSLQTRIAQTQGALNELRALLDNLINNG